MVVVVFLLQYTTISGRGANMGLLGQIFRRESPSSRYHNGNQIRLMSSAANKREHKHSSPGQPSPNGNPERVHQSALEGVA